MIVIFESVLRTDEAKDFESCFQSEVNLQEMPVLYWVDFIHSQFSHLLTWALPPWWTLTSSKDA